MKTISAAVFAAVLLACMPGKGDAGTTGTLSGFVVDSERKAPLAGVAVRVSGPSMDATTTTDAKGSYTFLALIPGAYSIALAKPGYFQETSRETVAVAADSDVRMSFAMARMYLIDGLRPRYLWAIVQPLQTADLYVVMAQSNPFFGSPLGQGFTLQFVPGVQISGGVVAR
jgi:hypothetical protein